MLENLRDKILNVQYDLSASFRNLATGDAQLSRFMKGLLPFPQKILCCNYQETKECCILPILFLVAMKFLTQCGKGSSHHALLYYV
ncbi:unnamed protein product [Larinioides sclopetarius]|uniref:Uncharacterized protein n=1 Tax=Larinioides sclopetarius TaxID=280406 RepID=A0AAV2AAI6_9ARAC